MNSFTRPDFRSSKSGHQKPTGTSVQGGKRGPPEKVTKWATDRPGVVPKVGVSTVTIVKLFTSEATVNGVLLLSGSLEPHFVSLLLILSEQRYRQF